MKHHEKTIDGIPYETETLGATSGLVILPRLVKLFGGPVLDAVFRDGEKFIEDPKKLAALLATPEMIGTILASVAKNASQDGGLLVIKDLLAATSTKQCSIGETTVPGNVYTHFDDHFGGRYGHLLNVAMWVATCNFFAP